MHRQFTALKKLVVDMYSDPQILTSHALYIFKGSISFDISMRVYIHKHTVNLNKKVLHKT